MSYSISKDLLQLDGKQVELIPSPNTGGPMRPQFLVIHYTASGPASDIAKYFSQPAAKVSAHLVVRRDGTVKQCVPFDVQAWHAGVSRWVDKSGTVHSGLNKNSIGIEIENWGPLTETGTGWVSWTGAPVTGGVTKAAHKYGKPTGGWELFKDEQIESVIGTAQAICEKYSIGEILGHDDIAPGRKSDPGPAWNMDSFIARVFGRASNGTDEWVVRSATGLNLRDAPSASGALIEPTPLADGTKVILHEANGKWRYVSVLNPGGMPSVSGWVHGDYLRDA